MSVIKSFSVGNGDMFYIKHGTDSFTIIDCNLDDSNKKNIISEIKEEMKRNNKIYFYTSRPRSFVGIKIS